MIVADVYTTEKVKIMKIALIDVDNWRKLEKCFPNLPLMKLSAFHKKSGDHVEWYNENKHYDIVYMSKVFSFSSEPFFKINADKVIRGGSGYAIKLINGKEEFDKKKHLNLSDQIEHIHPDYSIYGIKNTAYGFMSRGCPRGCTFCHVQAKEGCKSHKVANLSEFWNGQKNIELLDPNTFACIEWKDIVMQLIESKAQVNFNQGVDIRVMTPEKIEFLMKVNTKHIHFAWDRYEDKNLIVPKLEHFKAMTGWGRDKVSVYILTNYNTTIQQDLERIMLCRKLNFCPYVMRYDKEHIKKGAEINKLARWVNTKMIFWQCPTFEQYKNDIQKGLWV